MTVGTAAAGTFTVNNSTGPVGDYTSIQAAINAVTTTNGDTIIVYPGLYTENVHVYKGLIIKSQSGNPDDTIVQAASSSDHVFNVTADNVTINGLTATGAIAWPCFGIYLDGVSNCIVSNSTASNNCYGIFIYYSNNNTLSENIVSNNENGIVVSSSSNNTLNDNAVTSNNEVGIYLQYSSNNNTLRNNIVSNDRSGIWVSFSSNNTLNNNTVTSNNDFGIVLFFSSNSNTLINNNASNNFIGIYLSDSSNNIIYNNYFNNTNNVIFTGTNTGNVWNTTKTAGPNIIGGSFIGGNYWATPNGDGFSQNNTDTTGNGFCDSPLSEYEIAENNIDHLPLCLVTYNPYDKNKDCVIDIGEVNAAIDDYRTQGPTSIAEISELIDMYRSGGLYC